MPATDVDAYIAALPEAVQPLMARLRATVAEAAPGTTEVIAYQIPAARLGNRNLVYYAAWKAHLAVYPIPPLPDELEREVAPWRSGKDTLKLPFKRGIPFDLVARVVAELYARGHHRPLDPSGGDPRPK